MRLTAPAPDRRRAIEAREHAAAFRDSKEDTLIEEVGTRGTLRDRIELKPYAHGVAKLPADSRPPGSTFEELLELVVAAERAKALDTTAETVSVEHVPSGE